MTSLFLRNAWYVASWGDDLETGKIGSRRILGDDIVLFRGEAGAVVALRDMCPHRFAPLSLGRLIPGGIACSYHGLEFGEDGSCIRNPHTSGRIPAKASVRRYETIERDTLVWIWMGEAEADPALIPDFSFLAPDTGLTVTRRDVIRMPVDYRLLIDNLLDLSHISFLHDGLLGNAEGARAEIELEKSASHVAVSRVSRDIPVPSVFAMMLNDGAERGDMWNKIRWNLPSTLVNDALMTGSGADPMEGAGIFGAHLLTPEDENSTTYYIAAARQATRRPLDNGSNDEVRAKLGELRRFAFEEQDLPMIVAQADILRRYPQETRHGAFFDIDAGPATAKALLKQRIEEEIAAAANCPQVLT